MHYAQGLSLAACYDSMATRYYAFQSGKQWKTSGGVDALAVRAAPQHLQSLSGEKCLWMDCLRLSIRRRLKLT